MTAGMNIMELIVFVVILFVTGYCSCIEILNPCAVEELRTRLNVKFVDLSIECYLPVLPNGIFAQMENLTKLEIESSGLNHIGDYALNGLTALTTLTMHKNNISNIRQWCDHDLSQLRQLDLQSNHIETISSTAFLRYPNLEWLNLAHNKITKIESGTLSLERLESLDLTGNLIEMILEDTLTNVRSLLALKLANNKISFIDFIAFNDLTQLESLEIQRNFLNIFELDYVQNLSHLKYLNISSNFIDRLGENVFRNNKDLEVLDVSFNNIETFTESTFQWLEKLQVLNASNNRINDLNKYALEDLIALTTLDLSRNNLTQLTENLFMYTPDLSSLNVSFNKISEIGVTTFERPTLLSVLDLSHNQITSDDSLEPLEDLQHVNLSYNQLQSLNVTLNFTQAYAVLAHNPWRCAWLAGVIPQIDESRIHFGATFKIEKMKAFLNVSGIECEDKQGKHRSVIVVRDTKMVRTEEVGKENYSMSSVVLWLLVAILAVYIVLRAMNRILKKSEYDTAVRIKSHFEDEDLLQSIKEIKEQSLEETKPPKNHTIEAAAPIVQKSENLL